jgi:uncharacterized integral membrane protein
MLFSLRHNIIYQMLDICLLFLIFGLQNPEDVEVESWEWDSLAAIHRPP